MNFNNKDNNTEESTKEKENTIEELEKVKGFGPVKSKKYGEDLIRILSSYREINKCVQS